MPRGAFWLGLVVVLPVAVAHAQQGPGTGGAGTGTATATATVTATATATDTNANPSMTNEGSSSQNLTGYGYSDHTARAQTQTTPPPPVRGGLQVRSGTRAHRPVVPAAAGPVATLPGFEMLAEGGSRLFVELSQTVQVDERKARGSLTYVLHGAHVTVHNNTNPLVTVHFNTPVASARLVQSGHDLLFIVSLRADASPTWKMNPGKEGSTVLVVDFPKGSYVSGAAPSQTH
jgi:hypothetical protein